MNGYAVLKVYLYVGALECFYVP